MRRLIWLPIAGFLLVAGAAIAAAASAPTVTPIQLANQDTATPAPTAAASPQGNPNNDSDATPPAPALPGMPGMPGMHGMEFGRGVIGGAADLVDQVLADLVKAGTITQAQSDAITQALQQAVTDRQSQAEQEFQKMQQQWQQIQSFLEDGVITQAEVDQLPADSPFRQVFDSIAKDGQITLDQLRELRVPVGPGGPGMRMHDMGPGGSWDFHWPDDDSGQNPGASPSTSGASS